MSDLWTVQKIKDPEFVTRAYRKSSEALLRNPLSDFFDNPTNMDSNKATVRIFSAEKRPTQLNKKGAAAKTQDLRGIEEKTYRPYHAFNEVTLDMAPLEFMEQDDSIVLDSEGRGEISRQMEDFGFRHQMMRAVTLAKTVADGIVHIGADGDILESSTGAVTSVDLLVDATHKTDLDGIIADLWNDPAAKILDQLDDITVKAEEEDAPRPRHVWLHTDRKRDLRNNTQLKGFFENNETRVEQFLAGDIDDINGYRFHWFNGTYRSEDPTVSADPVVPFIPTKRAIITPDIGPWWRAWNHSQLIPRQVGILGEGSNTGDFAKAFGPFAYTFQNHNPPSISLFMGDNWFYAFADPNAVWLADVTA